MAVQKKSAVPDQETADGTRVRPGESPLRRGAVVTDELVGGPARAPRHAVELPRETAGAGGGGAQLHDQFADLGLGHHRANAIPSRPALTGVEAENLSAPSRQDGVDLRRRVGRANDIDDVDRLEAHPLAAADTPPPPHPS